MPPVAAAMPTLAAAAGSRNKSCGRCEVKEAAPCQAESLCAADARLPAPLGATLRAPLTTHHRQAGSTPLWQHLPHAGPLSSPPSAGNSRADGRWGVSWEWRLGRGRGPNGGLLPGKHNAGARQRQYYSQSGCEGLQGKNMAAGAAGSKGTVGDARCVPPSCLCCTSPDVLLMLQHTGCCEQPPPAPSWSNCHATTRRAGALGSAAGLRSASRGFCSAESSAELRGRARTPQLCKQPPARAHPAHGSSCKIDRSKWQTISLRVWRAAPGAPAGVHNNSQGSKRQPPFERGGPVPPPRSVLLLNGSLPKICEPQFIGPLARPWRRGPSWPDN